MSETVFHVRVPTPLLQYGLSERDIERHLNEWLVLSLFTEDRISSGKSAQLLGISRLDFLHLLHNRGIAYLNYTPPELNEEFESVSNVQGKLDE